MISIEAGKRQVAAVEAKHYPRIAAPSVPLAPPVDLNHPAAFRAVTELMIGLKKAINTEIQSSHIPTAQAQQPQPQSQQQPQQHAQLPLQPPSRVADSASNVNHGQPIATPTSRWVNVNDPDWIAAEAAAVRAREREERQKHSLWSSFFGSSSVSSQTMIHTHHTRHSHDQSHHLTDIDAAPAALPARAGAAAHAVELQDEERAPLLQLDPQISSGSGLHHRAPHGNTEM